MLNEESMGKKREDDFLPGLKQCQTVFALHYYAYA